MIIVEATAATRISAMKTIIAPIPMEAESSDIDRRLLIALDNISVWWACLDSNQGLLLPKQQA